MSKAITLSQKQWKALNKRLAEDHGTSMVMIRSKMKERLGFTTREHQVYDSQTGTKRYMCLDFYNEPKRTFFLLKYGEYLNDNSNTISI
jgi:hypothetical protein